MATVQDEGDIGHVFIVFSTMLMEHCQPVKGVLGFVSSVCLLYEALYLEDVVSRSLQLLAELGASLTNHSFSCFYFFYRSLVSGTWQFD